jgi:hypothetical protein
MKQNLLSTGAAVLLAASALSITTGYAQSVPLSDLLEKGIYAEETKGDLDGAIALYQQLIGDAKTNQRLAAQAQFRLGQCFLKKNRTAEATAAFQRLIKDFPDEKELIAKTRPHLPDALVLGPVPWPDGEELELTIKFANGADIGTMVYRARSAQFEGRKVWELGARMFAKAHSFSRVETSSEDFRPIRSRWMHTMLGDATATYSRDEVVLKKVGDKEPKTIAASGPIYDNEQAMHLMRRLPLAVGYKSTLPIFSSLSGVVIPIGIEVKSTETIETKAGKWECFKVDLSLVNQTFWFSTDPRRLVVRFAGGGVTADLTAIHQRKSGEPVRWQDAKLGVSLVAPSDWVIHLQEPDNEPDTTSVYLLDPEALAESCMLRLHAMSKLGEAEKKSSRAWADAQLVKLTTHFAGAKVRPESWKELKVSGRAATSFVADYTDNQKQMTFRAVYALGTGANAEQFTLVAEAAKFDGVQPAFESIVNGYQAK